MKKLIVLTSGISLAIFLTACTTTTPPQQLTRDNNAVGGKSVSQIQDKNWIATQIQGVNISSEQHTGALPSIQFSTDLRFSGSDGCNRIMGSYEADSMHIKLGKIASTMMMCVDANNALASQYKSALEKVEKYQVSNTTLILQDHQGNALIHYKTAVQAH